MAEERVSAWGGSEVNQELGLEHVKKCILNVQVKTVEQVIGCVRGQLWREDPAIYLFLNNFGGHQFVDGI